MTHPATKREQGCGAVSPALPRAVETAALHEVDQYAAWAPLYPPHAHNALMEVEQAAVLDLLPPVVGRIVLDAGCGTGRYARLLAALGARVVGVDLSPAMLARARGLHLSLVRGDLYALPLADASCDVIVCGLALPDLSKFAPAAYEWARVLRPRGVIVYSTIHPRGAQLGWTRTFESRHGTCALPAHWHTAEDQRRWCAQAGLAIESIKEPSLPRCSDAVAMVVRARRVRAPEPLNL
jgi:malonyl-CoA O-methyltransferase